MLVFLHDQRILIHFDNTVELKKLVILDPQWLLDIIKTIKTVNCYDHQERGFKDLLLKLEKEPWKKNCSSIHGVHWSKNITPLKALSQS